MDESSESPAVMLQRTLHVNSVLASKLVAGHLVSIEEVAYVPFAELLEVSGLRNEEASALRRVAQSYLLNRDLDDGL